MEEKKKERNIPIKFSKEAEFSNYTTKLLYIIF